MQSPSWTCDVRREGKNVGMQAVGQFSVKCPVFADLSVFMSSDVEKRR